MVHCGQPFTRFQFSSRRYDWTSHVGRLTLSSCRLLIKVLISFITGWSVCAIQRVCQAPRFCGLSPTTGHCVPLASEISSVTARRRCLKFVRYLNPVGVFSQCGKQTCSPNASLCPVPACFPTSGVCVFVRSFFVVRWVCVCLGEFTPVTHLLKGNTPTVLPLHVCRRRPRLVAQSRLVCSRGGNRPNRGRSAADRRCCRYLLVARLW